MPEGPAPCVMSRNGAGCLLLQTVHASTGTVPGIPNSASTRPNLFFMSRNICGNPQFLYIIRSHRRRVVTPVTTLEIHNSCDLLISEQVAKRLHSRIFRPRVISFKNDADYGVSIFVRYDWTASKRWKCTGKSSPIRLMTYGTIGLEKRCPIRQRAVASKRCRLCFFLSLLSRGNKIPFNGRKINLLQRQKVRHEVPRIIACYYNPMGWLEGWREVESGRASCRDGVALGVLVVCV